MTAARDLLLRLKDRLMAAVHTVNGDPAYVATVPQEMMSKLVSRAQDVHIAARHGVTLSVQAVAAAEESLLEFEAWHKQAQVTCGVCGRRDDPGTIERFHGCGAPLTPETREEFAESTEAFRKALERDSK